MQRSLLASSIVVLGLATLAVADGGTGGPYLDGGDPDLTPLDVQPNNMIDVNDLALVLAEWGNVDSFADFNGDGVVDGGDLGIILVFFGTPVIAADGVQTDDGNQDAGEPNDCEGCDNESAD